MDKDCLVFHESKINFDYEEHSTEPSVPDVDLHLTAPQGVVMNEESKLPETKYLPDIDDFIKKAKLPEVSLPMTVPREKTSVGERILAILTLLKESGLFFGKRNGTLYTYKEKKGFYVPVSTNSNEPHSLSEIIIKQAAKAKKDDVAVMALNQRIVDQIYLYLLVTPGCAVKIGETPSGYVNFKNIVVDIRTLKTVKHNPAFGFTFCIDCDFRANAVIGETSKEFLNNLAPDPKDRQSLLQATGLALAGSDTFDKSAFIIGPPANGKSTLAKFIESMLPDGACQNLDLNLLGDKFAKVKLADAQVSICHDLANMRVSQEAIATFKNLVTHDTIVGRDLYKSYRKIKPRCFLIFIGNDLPVFNDTSGAIQRRMWLIKTGNTVPAEERDPYLLNKLLEDKVGLVSTAIRAVHDAQLLDRPSNILSHAPEDFQPCFVTYDLNAVQTAWCGQHLIPNGNVSTHISVGVIREAFVNTIPKEYHDQVSENGFARALRKILPANAFFAKKSGVSCLCGYDLK